MLSVLSIRETRQQRRSTSSKSISPQVRAATAEWVRFHDRQFYRCGSRSCLSPRCLLVINLRKSSIEKDIDKTNDKIAVCNEKIAQNQILHNKMKIMQDYSNYVTSANAALETLPVVSSEMFDDIKEALGSFKYEGFTYNLEAGTVTLTKVELDDQSDVKTAIDALVGTGLFQEDVGYNGYSIGEEGSSGVTLDSLTLYLKKEAVNNMIELS